MFKMKHITLLTFFLVICFSKHIHGFHTLNQAERYASFFEEYPEIDNENWLNPDYTTFYKDNVLAWWQKILRVVGFYKTPDFPEKKFSELLKKVANERENKGNRGRFVKKITPKDKTNFFVFGDLHASFHSFIRDLKSLRNKGIIDNNFKIKNDYFIIINGNAIDLSPFTLEMLFIILLLMEKNPDSVIYTRGKHENKEHWKNFGLPKELEIRTPNIPERLIKRFFNTLPLALYITSKSSDDPEIVRISSFDRTYPELDEENFAKFLLTKTEKISAVHDLNIQSRSSQTVDIKAIIKTEERLGKYTQNTGLVQIDSDKGSTAWLVLSAPNKTFRSLYKFFYDAYAVITTNEKIDNWTIALYNQDVREKLGFKKRKEYKLTSGDEITAETKTVEKTKKPTSQLEKELQACKIKNQELTKKLSEEKKVEPKTPEPKVEKPPTPKTEDGEIVVGTTMGLTGNIAPESQSVKLGLRLRIDKENKAGGINGKKIRLIVLDDGYVPEKARANVQELIKKHNVDIILFPVGSATTKAYLDLVKEKKVVVLFSSSGSPDLRTPTPEYFIHFRPSYPDMVFALVSHAQKKYNAKKFATIWQSDVTATGIPETMKKALVKTEDYLEVAHKRNVTDMTKQAKEIMQFKPDGLLLWTTSAASMALLKEIGAENLLDTVALGADLANPKFNEFLEKIGISKKYVDAQALPNPETSQLSIMKECREALSGKPIDGLLAEAYVGASIFIHLLKQTGGSTDKEKIIKAAESINNLNLNGIKLNFDKTDRKLSSMIWLSTGTEWTPFDVSKIKKEEPAEKKAKKTTVKEKKEEKKEAAKKPEEKKEAKQAVKEKPKPGAPQVITIGTTLDMSKTLKQNGEDIKRGLDKALRRGVKEKNITFRLVALDDGYDPDRARKNVITLKEKHGAVIIASPLGSPTTTNYLDLIKKGDCFVLGPFSGSGKLHGPVSEIPYLMNMQLSYPAVELALFKHAKKMGLERFAFFVQTSFVEGVEDLIKQAGIKKENYVFVTHERNVTNFKRQVDEIVKFKTKAIFPMTTTNGAVEFLRQLGVENLFDKKIFGIQLGETKFRQFLKEQGIEKQFTDVQSVPDPNKSDLPLVKKYRTAMGNGKLDPFSLWGFWVGLVTTELVKACEGDITPQNLAKAVPKIRELDILKLSPKGARTEALDKTNNLVHEALLNGVDPIKV